MNSTGTVIVICGPTAVGKTAIAITLANELSTQIISADSRQCYKELSIGVARPSPEELGAVKHHFIASHSIKEDVTAADFEKYALDKTAELLQDHDEVVMTGGTGLYIKAFCEGLDAIPEIPASVRSSIKTSYQEYGLEWIQKEIAERDPAYSASGETSNPQRMMRALEVILTTGKSILEYQKKKINQREFRIIKLGLQLPREQLIERINFRVDQMMQAGLLEEVRSLMPFRKLNALQTVGYKELFEHLDGLTDLETAVQRIKINTRQYAKRQMTWFRRDGEITWFAPRQEEEIIKWTKAQIISAG